MIELTFTHEAQTVVVADHFGHTVGIGGAGQGDHNQQNQLQHGQQRV